MLQHFGIWTVQSVIHNSVFLYMTCSLKPTPEYWIINTDVNIQAISNESL